MGENKYEDPVTITKSHHKLLSTLLGRYSSNLHPHCNNSDSQLNQASQLCTTAKKQQSVRFFIAISMASLDLLLG